MPLMIMQQYTRSGACFMKDRPIGECNVHIFYETDPGTHTLFMVLESGPNIYNNGKSHITPIVLLLN